MKGFIAAVTEAIDADLIRSLRKPLALIWTHDEEVGCIGSAALASQLAQLDRPLPKLAWIGEPTDFRICNLHPGHAAFEINCIGRAAHSSRPSLGLNAIELASRVCIALSELQHTLRTERKFEEQLDAPFTILNLAQIHGGVAVNIVPNQCSLRIGARPLPGQSAEDILERIRNTLSPLDEEVRKRGGRIEIEPGDATPSLYTKPTCDLMSSLCVHASHPEPIGAPFATDGGNLTTLGMETLIFGPGSIDQAHRANEFIPEDDLFRTVKFVEQVVRTRCGV